MKVYIDLNGKCSSYKHVLFYFLYIGSSSCSSTLISLFIPNQCCATDTNNFQDSLLTKSIGDPFPSNSNSILQMLKTKANVHILFIPNLVVLKKSSVCKSIDITHEYQQTDDDGDYRGGGHCNASVFLLPLSLFTVPIRSLLLPLILISYSKSNCTQIKKQEFAQVL